MAPRDESALHRREFLAATGAVFLASLSPRLRSLETSRTPTRASHPPLRFTTTFDADRLEPARVGGEHAFVATTSNTGGGTTIHALTLDGAESWQFTAPGLLPLPQFAEGTLYALGRDHLYALDPKTGRTRWAVNCRRTTYVPIVDGTVYVICFRSSWSPGPEKPT